MIRINSMPIGPAEAKERFWSRVDRRGPDECWPWQGGRCAKGYGRLTINRRGIPATHVSLALAGSPRPSPVLIACHSCDNPPCCNPAHLWWGTVRDNALDASAKDRLRKPGPTPTHCRRGHALTGDNLRVGQRRRCRICGNEAERKSYRKRQALNPSPALVSEGRK